MPLNTFNLPGKNVPADKQLAMMRNYLENLKDDIESDLYNIDWNNFSKPLREKLEGLDKELIAQGDVVNSIQANYVSTQYLESEYVYAGAIQANQIQAGTLNSGVIYAGNLNASQINAGKINTTVFNASMLEAQYINASNQIKTSKLDATVITTTNLSAQSISVEQLTGGYIDASHIDADSIRAGLVVADDLYTVGNVVAGGHLSAPIISSKFSSSEGALFDRINVSMASSSDTGLRLHMGSTYAQVYLRSFAQGQYYLAVNMPY